MESIELQKELEVLAARRDDLRRELESAQETLTGAREAMLSGKPKALDALTTAQARVTALNETIAALDEQESLLQQNFDAAREHEQREAVYADLLRFDEDAEAAAREFETLRSEIDAAARESGARLIEARRKVIARQDSFLAKLQRVVPRFNALNYRSDEEAEAQLAEVMQNLAAHGAKLEAVRADGFRFRHRTTPISSNGFKFSQLAFGEAIDVIERIALRLVRDAEAASEAQEPDAA
jgi:predicted  nucleic acid-binding Zn-ribbon protein